MAITVQFNITQNSCGYGVTMTDTTTTTGGDNYLTGSGLITFQAYNNTSATWVDLGTVNRGQTLVTSNLLFNPSTTAYQFRAIYNNEFFNVQVVSNTTNFTIQDKTPYIVFTTNIAPCNPHPYTLEVEVQDFDYNNVDELTSGYLKYSLYSTDDLNTVIDEVTYDNTYIESISTEADLNYTYTFSEKKSYLLTVELSNGCSQLKKNFSYYIDVCDNFIVEYKDCNVVKITSYKANSPATTYSIYPLDLNSGVFSSTPTSTGTIPLVSTTPVSVEIQLPSDNVYYIAITNNFVDNTISTKNFLFLADCNIKKCIQESLLEVTKIDPECTPITEQNKIIKKSLLITNYKDIIYYEFSVWKNQLAAIETADINDYLTVVNDIGLLIDNLLNECNCGTKTNDCGCQ